MTRRSNHIETGEPLTDREREVLAAAAEGLTNHEIAETLFIGFSTVKTHLDHARTKLGARNTTHAVVLADRASRLTNTAEAPHVR